VGVLVIFLLRQIHNSTMEYSSYRTTRHATRHNISISLHFHEPFRIRIYPFMRFPSLEQLVPNPPTKAKSAKVTGGMIGGAGRLKNPALPIINCTPFVNEVSL